MIQLSTIGENKTIYVTAFNNRHNSYEKFINCLTKMKLWCHFTHDNLLATEKIGGHKNNIGTMSIWTCFWFHKKLEQAAILRLRKRNDKSKSLFHHFFLCKNFWRFCFIRKITLLPYVEYINYQQLGYSFSWKGVSPFYNITAIDTL